MDLASGPDDSVAKMNRAWFQALDPQSFLDDVKKGEDGQNQDCDDDSDTQNYADGYDDGYGVYWGKEKSMSMPLPLSLMFERFV